MTLSCPGPKGLAREMLYASLSPTSKHRGPAGISQARISDRIMMLTGRPMVMPDVMQENICLATLGHA